MRRLPWWLAPTITGLTLVLLLMTFYVLARGQEPYVAEGASWDPDLWSALYMPDSTVACRWSDGMLSCVPVPSGSVLLIPTREMK